MFLFLHLKSSYILLKFSLNDAMVIFGVLEGDLSLLLELSQLVEVLEHQMLHSLFIDLHFNFMLFRQVLQLALLVSELCLLIFQLLFADDPEVVNTLALILV